MDTTTYALAKKYVELTAVGLGAVKGAPCVIQSVTDNGEANEVTFKWTGDDGTVQTRTITVPHGISVETMDIDENNHLICLMSDGSEIDAGEIPSFEPVLTEALSPNVTMGSLKTSYPIGTSLEEIIRDMLTEKVPPTVTMTLNPSATLYDEVNDSINSITINATVTKKTNSVAKVEFYLNGTLVHTTTSGVTSGGTFPYIHNTLIDDDTTIKVVVTDTEGLSSNASKTITFIGNSYYGIVDATIGEPTEALIKTLNKSLKNSKKFSYSGITCDYNKVVYAYPKELGALTSIMDKVNNFNYTSSFQLTTKTVDGIDYYVYTLIDPTGAVDVTLTFE